jgi:hypothetical protein
MPDTDSYIEGQAKTGFLCFNDGDYIGGIIDCSRFLQFEHLIPAFEFLIDGNNAFFRFEYTWSDNLGEANVIDKDIENKEEGFAICDFGKIPLDVLSNADSLLFWRLSYIAPSEFGALVKPVIHLEFCDD